MHGNNQPPPFDGDSDKTERIDLDRTRRQTPVQPQHGGHVKQTGAQVKRPSTRQPTTPAFRNAARERSARRRKRSGLYLPLWSLGLMLLFVGLAVGGIIFVVYSIGGGVALDSTPIIKIITAIPSNTPQFTGQVLATPTFPPEVLQIPQGTPPELVLSGPTLPPPAITPTPETIELGKQVVVIDVGEQGLNVRDVPGVIGTNILFLGAEGELFNVLDGPEQRDGFIWWWIQNPTDPTRAGWAADAYLRVQSQQ